MTRTMHRTARVFFIGTTAALAGAVIIAGQQPPATGTFTAAQAAAGRQRYDASCASCHLSDLGGSNEAPPLVGVNFMNTWGARTTDLLAGFIQTAMPPAGPRLSMDQALDVTAFILQSNGARPGAQPLTTATKMNASAAIGPTFEPGSLSYRLSIRNLARWPSFDLDIPASLPNPVVQSGSGCFGSKTNPHA